jgi:hypothetical protein
MFFLAVRGVACYFSTVIHFYCTPMEGFAFSPDRTGKEGFHEVEGPIGTPTPSGARFMQAADGRYALVKDAKPVIAATFREVYPFREGLALVRTSSGRVSFIDERGKQVSGEFDGGDSFSEGRAGVYSADKDEERFWVEYYTTSSGHSGEQKHHDYKRPVWRYLKTDGENALSGQRFDYAGPFEDGKALVRLGADWMYVDAKGEKLSEEPEKEDIEIAEKRLDLIDKTINADVYEKSTRKRRA